MPRATCLLLSLVYWAMGLSAVCADKPNVLVIVSDDHGYADVGFQGGKDVPTPNLDRLAAGGVRCTAGYVSHPFCSPTRAGLLTGRHQARFGHVNNPVYDPLDAAEGLPLSERLLPQYLQTAGYTTGWVGKWHLGASPDHAPWQRGFAETFGFIGGGHQFLNWKPDGRQYTLPLVRNGQPEDLVPEHLTPALGKEAAEFIDRNAAKPWFLYVAFNAPHTPHQPTAEREATFGHIADAARRKYLAQVSLLDDAIGQITDRLRSTGQDRRTLVFFFSDNGGPTKNAAVNTPLRGAKGSVFEGGIRVPFVIGFSDRLKAGTTYDQPVSSLDVMATALAAAEIKMPTDKVYDSVDLLPYLTGEKQGAPHQRLFWRAGQGKVAAVREGDWKLLKLEENRTELFNLVDDIGEAKNLAAEQPTIVAKLDAALAQWDSECVPPAFPGSSVKPEDWGPGGANRKMPATRLGKPGMVGD